MVIKAAVYCRVSTEDQEKEGTSLGSQLAACLEKATELGYEVPDELVYKETYSGLAIDRPLFGTLREKVKAGIVDAVIVFSPDRLSRVGEDVLTLFKEFKLAGVKLIFVNQQFDDSMTGKMLGFILGWASEFEASQIKERTRRGKRTKAQNGYLPQGTGIGLYGYRWDKVTKKRVPIEREAKVVQRIFDIIAQGKTRYEVARQLNEQGIPTKSGSKWHPLTIERMVRNPAYTGTTYFGKTTMEGKCRKNIPRENWTVLNEVTPAIIEKTLFDRAQLVLKQSKELRRGRPQNKYLLTGHIRCGVCGSPLVGTCLGHKYRYYNCRANYPTSISPPTCHAGYIRADDIEEVVWLEVRKVIENPSVIMTQLKRKAKKPSSRNIEKEIVDAKKKLDILTSRENKLISLFEVDSITREELVERVNKLKIEKQEAEIKLAQLTAIKKETIDIDSLEEEVRQYCQQVKDSLDNCSFINKRIALDVLQVEVVATPEKYDIKIAVPLEYTTVERKREYELPIHKQKAKIRAIV
jgi:site-specific DNA recombinase